MSMSKKDKILNAAISLFDREGLSVPTARIAKEASVSNGTLFNYFATKQDLIDGLYFDIHEKKAEILLSDINSEASLEDDFFKMWQRYINWALNNQSRYRVVRTLYYSNNLSEHSRKKVDALFERVTDIITDQMQQGYFIKVDPDYIAHLANAHLTATIDYLLLKKPPQSQLPTFIRLSFSSFWNSILQKNFNS